jgi:GntR family transcriptional regulator, transcriptional repressor for pyruvate dehydrogenase complex
MRGVSNLSEICRSAVASRVPKPSEKRARGAVLSGLSPASSPKTGQLLARKLRALIVDGVLKDGDHLPTEPELVRQLNVSRPIVREALRILEDERLIEVRRGSRSGPRVRIPGPEIVARPAGLLLQLSGATLADVERARGGFEPLAAGLLASGGSPKDFDELDAVVAEDFPAAWAAGDLGTAVAWFHRRLVELSDNAVLAVLAGVVHDITCAHDQRPDHRRVTREHFEDLTGSCQRLIDLMRAGESSSAEQHWRMHLDSPHARRPGRVDGVRVRDVPD